MLVKKSSLFLNFKASFSITKYRDANLQSIVRDKMGGLFRPFDKTNIPAVKIIFITEVEQLRWIIDPVEIKMINYRIVGSVVFINECECRTADFIAYPKFLTDCLDEGSLSGTHFPIKSDNFSGAKYFEKLPGSMVNFFGGLNNKFSHKPMYLR